MTEDFLSETMEARRNDRELSAVISRSSETIFSSMKRKLRHSHTKKNWENLPLENLSLKNG